MARTLMLVLEALLVLLGRVVLTIEVLRACGEACYLGFYKLVFGALLLRSLNYHLPICSRSTISTITIK